MKKKLVWAVLVLAMGLVAGPVAAKMAEPVYDWPPVCPPTC